MLHRLNRILCASICWWVVLTAVVTGGWSPDFLSRTQALSCRPGDLKTNVTFLHAMSSGYFTKLGKATDMEVCALLCCEINKCEAAFMARNNCYAVACFSEHHCATAPARNNKWQPMITFVQKLKNNKISLTRNKEGSKQDAGMFPSNKQILGSTLSKTSLKLATTKLNKASKKEDQDNMLYEEDRAKESNVLIDTGDNSDSTELDALQRRPSAQYKNYHEKNPQSTQYSLVSAAVATCLMAFLLSGIAVVAARIRNKRAIKESQRTGNQYSEVPTEP